jgi:rRNA-processing protein FCF1
MRYGRAKQARKTLQFFERRVGLRAPYHVLIDGTFVVAFTKHGLPLQERVEKLLQASTGSIVFVSTKSVLDELDRLAEKSQDTEKTAILQRARAWMKQHCSKLLETIPTSSMHWISASHQSHLKDLSSAGLDLVSVLTESNIQRSENKMSVPHGHKFVAPPLLVASQDEALLHLARQSGMVPVIRLARGSVLLLEHPSQAAQTAQEKTERSKWTVRNAVAETERQLVTLVKKKEREEKQTQQTQSAPNPYERRKKHKAKGPNPLSCKKKNDVKHRVQKK